MLSPFLKWRPHINRVHRLMQAYVGESVLLRYNGDDRYGDGNNFEVCTTAETKAALENVSSDSFSHFGSLRFWLPVLFGLCATSRKEVGQLKATERR